jgi:DNA-binding XRE family transcriptional regulator
MPRIIEFLGYVPYDAQAKTLGEQIIAYRKLLGLTQKELARRLGVGPAA